MERKWGGVGGEAAWLSCAVICPLGQFASKWKRTFPGMNDERGFVLPLQPAVTVYEVSHVLGFCQRGGFDGQGLQRRDQLSMRPLSLGWSLPHRKREETVYSCHPSPAETHPCLSWGLACIPYSHQGALLSSLPTDCLKLQEGQLQVCLILVSQCLVPGRYKICKSRNRKGKSGGSGAGDRGMRGEIEICFRSEVSDSPTHKNPGCP